MQTPTATEFVDFPEVIRAASVAMALARAADPRYGMFDPADDLVGALCLYAGKCGTNIRKTSVMVIEKQNGDWVTCGSLDDPDYHHGFLIKHLRRLPE